MRLKALLGIAAGCVAGVTSFGIQAPAMSANDGWLPLGASRKTGAAAFWAKTRNAERINNEAYKVWVRFENGHESLAKLN